MKNRNYVYVVFPYTFMSCSAQRKLAAQTSFKLGPARSQNYVGGSDTDGTVTVLNIPVTIADAKAVNFLEVFHRGKNSRVATVEIDNGQLLSIELPNSKNISLQAIAF